MCTCKIIQTIIFVVLILSRLYAYLLENQEIRAQLKIFSDCHIKFIEIQWATFLQNDTNESMNRIFRVFDNATVRSIENVVLNGTNQGILLPRWLNGSRNFNLVSKFTSCFIHIYVPHDNTLQYLGYCTELMQYRGEWPHHFIIFEDFDLLNPARLSTYIFQLPKTFARGLILVANLAMNQIFFICIPCAWRYGYTDDLVAVTIEMNLDTLRDAVKHGTLSFHSNLHLTPIRSDAVRDTMEYCKLTSRFEPAFIMKLHTFCIHQILATKFNYTITISGLSSEKTMDQKNHSGKKYPPLVSTTFGILPSRLTLRSAKYALKKSEWLSYGVVSEHLEFIAFQKRPSFSGNALIQPYDWRGWTLCVSTIAAVLVVALTYSYRKAEISFATVFMSITASILDQPATHRVAHRPYMHGEIISVWIAWTLMLIILVNGYKSFIFSFLTAGSRPEWPGNLMDLVSDAEYCVLSTNSEYTYDLENDKFLEFFSHVRRSYLEPMMKGTPGADYPTEYFLLNKTLQFYPTSEQDIFSEIIIRNKHKHDRFHVGLNLCTKFALVQLQPGHDAVSLLYLMKNLVMSEAARLPRFRQMIPTSISRNFFTESFIQGVSILEQMGMLQAWRDHVSRWHTCLLLGNRELLLKHGDAIWQQNSTEGLTYGVQRRRCCAQVTGYPRSPNKLREIPLPNPISSQQFLSTFQVCFVMLVTSLMCFLVELLKLLAPITSLWSISNE